MSRDIVTWTKDELINIVTSRLHQGESLSEFYKRCEYSTRPTKLELCHMLQLPYKKVDVDTYTKDVLLEHLRLFKEYTTKTNELNKMYYTDIRGTNFPEHISENIVKFVIQNIEKDKSCVWAKSIGKPGDLYTSNGSVEVKAFSSKGPTTFGPHKKFNTMYFLDACEWKKSFFVVYKTILSSTDQGWKSLKISEQETIEDKMNKGQRPHLNWCSLSSQLKKIGKLEEIYRGTLSSVFE